MPRTAHYVPSTHWDREWYEPLQAFRMRLVSMLDEVFDTLENDKNFKTFVMDGQTIPIYDYLEIRPEKKEAIIKYLKNGRLKLGPWYVLPDEWLVSGESLIRNLETGIRMAEELGGKSSKAGFLCDMFGHTGQMPQILSQIGITGAFIWRGTHEKEHKGQLFWKAPDGSVLPSYRFGKIGYCSYAIAVRKLRGPGKKPSLSEFIRNLIDYTLEEAKRTPSGPILLFDGGDHLEIEPLTSKMITEANKELSKHNIKIIHSDLDSYLDELAENRSGINKTLVGELRETGRERADFDEQWLIPGVLSSRIHLKQKNAQCEDELCLWAEPFCSFAAASSGTEYPEGFLRTAWKYLLENHPHDSICGCSPDQVHNDMIYRFDQSYGISSRLTVKTLEKITALASPLIKTEGAFVLGIFNNTAETLDEALDIPIPLPKTWPTKYQEFFGFEEKFSFKIIDENGREIPYQLVSQAKDQMGAERPRYRFPYEDPRHVINITAKLAIPPYGYTTIVVEPFDGPTRYMGSIAVSHNTIENEFLRIKVESNGTITLTDKKSGRKYDDLLLYEDRADIGDGWYHGVAVNDHIYNSSACASDISLITDGICKATIKITTIMNVPESFDFKTMTRSEKTMPLKISSEITLRNGSDFAEINTTVENNVYDHRLRVLFPTNLDNDYYYCDSAFDVVKRPVSVSADNSIRRELDVETRPQITWTAFTDTRNGLALISRGLPESAVLDNSEKTIALTLLRGFRKAVFCNDNMGGEIIGTHTFRYYLKPFEGDIPINKLFILGQRVNTPIKVSKADIDTETNEPKLPSTHSFMSIDGNAVVSSVQRIAGNLTVRIFNPNNTPETVSISVNEKFSRVRCVTLNGENDTKSTVISAKKTAEILIQPKRIATVIFEKI